MTWVPLLLSQWQLGNALQVSINPRSLLHYSMPPRDCARKCGKYCRHIGRSLGFPAFLTARLQGLCNGMAGLTPADSSWGEAMAISCHPKAALLEDFVRQWPNFRRSILYLNLYRELLQSGLAKYRSQRLTMPQQLEQLFASRLGPLLVSLKDEGYRCQPADEIGTALIDADGALLKSDKGDHRFFLCRALDVAPVPLRVVAIHPQWLASQGLSLAPWHGSALRAALRRLERRYQ